MVSMEFFQDLRSDEYNQEVILELLMIIAPFDPHTKD